MLRIGKKPTIESAVVLGKKPRGPPVTLGHRPKPTTTRRIASGPR
jgi:hypothetical protein